MVGLIGKKMGMLQLFHETGEIVPVTVIEAGPCSVIDIRTKERHGYRAVVLGFGIKRSPNKPYAGIFQRINRIRPDAPDIPPTQVLREIRDFNGDVKIGDLIDVSIFKPGMKVDVTGYTKGRGFAGVMKRYGFAGGPDSHGSKFHRRLGSIGTSKTPGRILKGKKMPGRYGCDKQTVLGLEVVKVDKERNLLFVKGSVPGPRGGYLIIRSHKGGEGDGG